jgi:uracil-DNA glycosylase family 4
MTSRGFFSVKETQSKSRPDGHVLSCSACGLYKNCKSPKMQPYGNFKKGILNIGEAPTETDDDRDKPWQGKTGRLLQQAYKELGIDLFEDCLNINSAWCRPTDTNGNNRPPTNDELNNCRRFVLFTIAEYKPQVIMLFGNSALYSVIGHRWKKDLNGITQWRGWTIPDRDFNAWICPTFHPSYIERSDQGAENTVWMQDLERAMSKVDLALPEYNEPDIEVITDLSILRKSDLGTHSAMVEPIIAFDYETTGKKPHAEGHRIVSCAVADSEDHAFVFLMPNTRIGRQPFIDLLTDPKIAKVAQNMGFEETWSTVRLKHNVENWGWDTMLASHVLDNREGITGLKFQTYVQFGIVDYSSELDLYLKPVDKKNGNALNRIFDLLKLSGGEDKLLLYNGLDAIYTYRLCIKQRLEMLPF